MITLRELSINLGEKETRNLFVHLHIDTDEHIHMSFLERLLKGEIGVQKPWIGIVDKPQKKFKIRRTKTGIFKINESDLEVYGESIEANDGRLLKIKIELSWFSVPYRFWLAVLPALFWNQFDNVFGWVILIAFLVLQVYLLVRDINKTDKSVREYIADKTHASAEIAFDSDLIKT
jgi:hypothetical protein